jgi:hypothetical protein
MLGLIAAVLVMSTPDQLHGRALLDDLASRAVKYFIEQSEPATGLTLDRAPNDPFAPASNPAIASIASTGFALASYPIGVERGILKREEALARARRTVETVLTKLEGAHGWYYHFVDWKTGKRQWNCEVSSIDSGLLFAGMLMAESGLKDAELSRLVGKVLDRVDWNWMLTDGDSKPSSLTFCMGWSPEHGFINCRWSDYAEHMFLYVLAYALWKDCPAGCWAAWNRPEIVYKGIQLFTGGPLFMHEMSQGFIDFRNLRDSLGYDYFVEGRSATLANRQYCIDNPKGFKGYDQDHWGLSACDNPDGYGGQGAPGWIEDNGTLAPPAAVAAVLYVPELSIRAAEAFLRDYPAAYGRYGFAGGINPSKNWIAKDVLGIDLGQMMLNIENYLNGKPHAWMMSQPSIAKAMERIGFKKTSEGPLDSRALHVSR